METDHALNNPVTMRKNQTWSIYLIRCKDNTLYTGIALDVKKRFEEHHAQGKRCAKYLRGKGPLKVVFAQEVGDKSEALKIERKIKALSKAEKEALIANKILP